MCRKGLALALILLLGIPLAGFCGELRQIEVIDEGARGVEVRLIGDIYSYLRFGLKNPARFYFDIEDIQLGPDVPKTLPVEGDVLSEIRIGERGQTLRVVLESANPDRLFATTVQKNRGRSLIIKCWKQQYPVHPIGKPAVSPEKEEKLPLLKEPEDRPFREKTLAEVFNWPVEAADDDKAEKEPETRVIRYVGKPVYFDFFEEDIRNVLRLFATPELVGENVSILIDPRVDGTVTMKLNNTPWDMALEFILDEFNLVKEERGQNFLVIKPRPKAVSNQGQLVFRKVPEKILKPSQEIRRKEEKKRRAWRLIEQADRLEREGNIARALAVYDEALTLYQGDNQLINKIAYLNYAQGENAACFYYAGRALRQNPKDAKAALYGAMAAVRMDRSRDAEVLFRLATIGDAKPKLPEAFSNYGLFLEEQGEDREALAIYREYEGRFPPSFRVSLAAAEAAERLGRTDIACRRYKEIRLAGFELDAETLQRIEGKINDLCEDGGDPYE